jgi:hypothetical protein
MKNGKIEEIKVNENPASIQDIEWWAVILNIVLEK